MRRRRALAGIAGALSLGGLCGCADTADTRLRRVRGLLLLRDRGTLPRGAEVTVRLQDVSRMDVPAVVLAQWRLTVGDRQPPYRFDLGVEPARIDERNRYAMAARVELDTRLLYINDLVHPVLTQGAGDEVRMVLVSVARRPG